MAKQIQFLNLLYKIVYTMPTIVNGTARASHLRPVSITFHDDSADIVKTFGKIIFNITTEIVIIRNRRNL
jgi:hypothetical protein